MIKNALLLVFIVFLYSCNSNTDLKTNTNSNALKVGNTSNKFKDYWYQGTAEITSYDLEQARYGELHQGNAVMIFVTEEFSKDKKVKLDDPGQTPKDAVPVLKLNATRNFITGIYPYSMMTSTFTPVDLEKHPHSLKVSCTSQEWCGHTFMELEEGNNHFDYELRSYFESEGDKNSKVEKVLLEDEIWTRLRINPQSLPTGNIKVLPGSIFARLSHIDYQAYPAEANMTAASTDDSLMVYSLKYSDINRTLDIYFKKEFPYEIEKWEDSMTSGFGKEAKTLRTTAVKKRSMMTDYWTKNNNADLGLREELGLTN